jgi:A/G-specific adenine glycosylase
MSNFSQRLLAWWDEHGRKDLPWQRDTDPYKIWLSEIMLQQTQVATVTPYFERFVQRFPRVQDLAGAEQDEVLHLWSGLGYYARGRNLHAAAKKVVDQFGGEFPRTLEELIELPGVGRSTAGAILAQAFELPVPILDGNVKRVITRLEGITEWSGQSKVEKQLWQISEELLPDSDSSRLHGSFQSRFRDSSTSRFRDYTQAIMDLGATVCKRSNPDCERCPFTGDCQAYINNQTDEIPARKPKKTKPVREKIFLVLRNSNGEVLLEKRPTTGIWGGLWSFPEATPDELDSTLDERLCNTCHQEWMPQGSHVFSHFQLNYRPLLITCDNNSSSRTVDEAGQHIWYSDALENRIGLAAPVAGLLRKIQDLNNG